MKMNTKLFNYALICVFFIGLISSHAEAVQRKKVAIQNVRPDKIRDRYWPGQKGRKKTEVGVVRIQFNLREHGKFTLTKDFKCVCYYFDGGKKLIDSRCPNMVKKRGAGTAQWCAWDEPILGNRSTEIVTSSDFLLNQKTRYIIVVMEFKGDYALGLWPTGLDPREFDFPDKDIAIQHAIESGTLRLH
jgi:hypothetical protein